MQLYPRKHWVPSNDEKLTYTTLILTYEKVRPHACLGFRAIKECARMLRSLFLPILWVFYPCKKGP